ncbi:hypothetical protein MKW92_020289 [Papaver armeniacum]|nr:hypothetical protein MKW92_020289 [Papaver armeniacum]
MSGAVSLSALLTNSLISSLRTSKSRNLGMPMTLIHSLAVTHVFRKQAKMFGLCSYGSRTKTFSISSSTITTFGATLSNSSSDCPYPEYSRLLPCPSQNGLPRVEHLVVRKGGPVLEYISKAVDLPPQFVADLIHFGAVYYALVCPTPPPTATTEQIKIFKEVTDPDVLRKRKSIKGKTFREAQKTFRITRVDEFVEAGTYLRVHIHPKRFPRCYEIDWKSRIIAVTESYVILDKPAGTSVGGTTDNIEESCATFATRALGLTDPLWTTHQIDNCTEGCVVLARTKQYCSVFHGKIREKKVKKLYLALAAAPVPIGVVTHYMRPVNVAPRLVSKDITQGWHMCQLEVLECKEVPWPTASTEQKLCIDNCGWPKKDVAYECKINLLTGKTHQVRAQLAAIGAPIVGDSMYIPSVIAEAMHPGLNPFGEDGKHYESEDERTKAVEEWMAQHGKEPSIAIGLQACQISWDDGEHFYEARTPWWR